MPAERVLYEFPGGGRESRQPPTVAEVGDASSRRARVWTVSEVTDRGDVIIVTVQTTDRGPDNSA